jgi:hypothetical protein
MIIECISDVGTNDGQSWKIIPTGEDLNTYMVSGVNANQYNVVAAELLATVATWEYTDLQTFALMVASHGLPGCTCVAIRVSNAPLLMDTSALLIQSKNKDLVILCFRGTEPTNAINWATDVTARQETFTWGGTVHGGFENALKALKPVLDPLITDLIDGKHLWNTLRDKVVPLLGVSQMPPATALSPPIPPTPPPPNKVAFYLAGHSLGGALAALAGAHIYADSTYAKVKDHLLGIYTFGQPRIGDRDFARILDNTLGQNLFRHVYRRDIVPRLPPRTMGNFEHVGQLYVSTERGWGRKMDSQNPVFTGVWSVAVGVAAFVFQEVFPFDWLWARLPVSWADHSPRNYEHVSRSPSIHFTSTLPDP